MAKLKAAQIKAALAGVPDWRKQGRSLTRLYQLKDFPAAIKFVGSLARLAEKANHHPDIDIRWNKVTLTLSTHDQCGLTKKDFALAKKIDQL